MSVRVLGLFMSALAACFGANAAEGAACSAPIKIGLTTALTGHLAPFGVQARNGVEFAVDEINRAGGIAGQPIALAVDDSGSSPAGALNVLDRVTGGKPLVIFGSMISQHVMNQIDEVSLSETPFIVAATSAKSASKNSKWLFRVHAHDGQLARMLPQFLTKLGLKRPGIMAVADDFGLGASQGIVEALRKGAIEPAAVTSYAPLSKDVSAQLIEVKTKGADSLILFGRPSDVAPILKQMQTLGIALPLIGNTSLAAPTTLNNFSANEADGAYSIGGMIPLDEGDPKIADWSKRVLERYKVPADNFTVAYYDAMHLLKTVIEKAGCDKAAIRDGLASVKGWKGLLITYDTDKQGNMAHTLGVYRIKGNKPELIETINDAGS